MSMQIDLRKIRCQCISMKKSTSRRENIARLMKRLEFDRWDFFDGVEDEDHVLGCAKSHISALTKHDFREPLLLLEDDVDITPDYTNTFSVPDNTDALYLGYSWWAWDKERASMSKLDNETVIEKEENYYRVSNMTSTHAILYLTKSYADSVVNAIENYLVDESGNRHCDVAIAKMQKNHNVIAAPKHYFFQMCPRNTYWTNRSILV